MPPPRFDGAARWSRRKALRSVGGLGVASVLWTLGCAPALVAPGVAPAVPPPLPRPALSSPVARQSSTAGALPTKIGATSPVPAHRSPTALPTAPPATRIVPTATPVPSAMPTPRPPATATPSPTPTARTYDPARLVDVIAHARTSYAGLAYGPATNVEVAARRINEAAVAPGATFSFLDRLGPQTFAAGFQVGYGIILQNSQPRTVPMIAGAICDVSTLLFQAVFRAGLPIVERHSHSYWIAHYGDPPDGAIGLEATVDVQPADFRFRNTTRDWLRIACNAQNGALAVTIYGVNPGWTVAISPPVVTNVVKTEQTVVRQPDPTLPPGAEVWVETAQDGFDVSQERRVQSGGRVIDVYRVQSHYLPSHNVIAVGTAGTAASPTGTAGASPRASSPPTSVSAIHTATSAVRAVSTPGAAIPTPTSGPPTATPTPAGGTLAAGQARVPALVGLPVTRAQELITQSGLTTTYVNYQGSADIPAAARQGVPVGAVLSQVPAPGAVVPRGTRVYLAARKE